MPKSISPGMASPSIEKQVPKALGANHRLMAFMIAAGMRPGEVARRVGMNKQRVSIIQRSPLFRTLVEQHRREIIERGMKTTIDKIMGDAPINVDFLRELRDGKVDGIPIDPDSVDIVRVRLQASNALFDRQAPKRTETDTRSHLTITVEHEQKLLADQTCAEVGDPIEPEFTNIDAADEQGWELPAPPEQITIASIDDVIDRYRQREEEEAV